MENITDQIYSAMLKEKKEYSNEQILNEFFKVNFRNNVMAKKIVEPLLKTDTRFKQLRDHTWTAVKSVPIEKLSLNEVPFILFYIEDPKRVHISLPFKGKITFSALKELSSFILYKGGMIDDGPEIEKILKNMHRYIFIPYDIKSLWYLKKIYKTVSPLQPEFRTLSIKSLIWL